MKTIELQVVKDKIEAYQRNSECIHSRYRSFDFCYIYFYENRNRLLENMEQSCLQLASFLASWGMFRGNSTLLQKNIRYYEPIIRIIADPKNELWGIDIGKYNKANIEKIIATFKAISEYDEQNASVTLATKIMLGVYGCVPAFDRFFTETFRKISDGECGFRSFDSIALDVIKKFYESSSELKEYIDSQSELLFCQRFNGEETDIKYPVAKIIDMFGFQYSYVDKNEGDSEAMK